MCFRGLCDSVAAAERETAPPGEMVQEDEKEMKEVDYFQGTSEAYIL